MLAGRRSNNAVFYHQLTASKDSDTFDWAHPSPQGERKMAAAWLAAMKPYLPTSKIQPQQKP